MRRKCTKPRKSTAKPDGEPDCPDCGSAQAYVNQRDYYDRATRLKCQGCGTAYPTRYGQTLNQESRQSS